MGLSSQAIAALGDELYRALRTGSTLAPLTAREPALTLDEAYAISLHGLRRRLAGGECVIGKKIGVTSKAVQDLLGVHQPDFGFLTDRMQCDVGSRISMRAAGLIQPRAEGEIAFVLKRALRGPGVIPEQVLEATDFVSPCFEVVDSRIRDWNIRIQDTVADNASCGVFVLGAARALPRALDLAAVRMDIHRNGERVATGLGAAVQGHPANAVAWLANTLGAYGIAFDSGEVILSGSLAPLLPVSAGDRYEMQLSGIGGAAIEFVA